MSESSRLDWSMFSLTVAAKFLMIMAALEGVEKHRDEITEQLQAIEWGEGMRP